MSSTSKISPYQMGRGKARAAADEILRALRTDYVVRWCCVVVWRGGWMEGGGGGELR